MSKWVAPVRRLHANRQVSASRHGSWPATSPAAPRSAMRTDAMAGSAQPQSVMARPSSARTTQLSSTAPPSTSTHAGSMMSPPARAAMTLRTLARLPKPGRRSPARR